MSEAPGRTTQVSVEAPSDVETIVFDHRYREVGRGTGSFPLALEPGLYKYKFRRATRFVETFGSVEAAPVVVKPPDGLRLESSAPLSVSEGADEAVWTGARDTSLEVHARVGDGSQLMVFLRPEGKVPSRCGTSALAPPDLSLLTADGRSVWNFRRRRDRPAAPCPWWGCTLALDPGTYRLRLRTRRWGALEQTVLAHAGWQTQVFLSRRRQESAAARKKGGRRRASTHSIALTDAAILLSRIGTGFDPESEALKLAESVRLALGHGQTRMAVSLAKRSLEECVSGPRGNPLLGVFVAHALRLAAELRPDQTTFPDENFDALVASVERSIGRNPDLDVLKAHLGRLPRSDVDLDVPPMLLVSYELVRRMAAKDPAWMEDGTRWSWIAGALWGSGPWLIWRAQETGRRRRVAASAPARDVAAQIDALETSVSPSELEPENAVDAAIVSYLEGARRAQKLPTATGSFPRPTPPGVARAPQPPPPPKTGDPVERMAAALALPRSLVRERLEALLEKLPRKT